MSCPKCRPAPERHANPISKTWQSFTTEFYLNSSASNYWPDELTVNYAGGHKCTGTGGLDGNACVAYGTRYLQSYFYYARNKGGYQTQTQEPEFPRILGVSTGNDSVNLDTWASAPRAATS